MSTQRKIPADRPPRPTSGFLFEELEPRLLLSADLPLQMAPDFSPDDTGTDTLSEVGFMDAAHLPASIDIVSETRELVFIDTGAPEYQKLLQDLRASADESREFEIILFDAGRDGIEAITEALSARSGLNAVHIISHGSEGALALGSARLDFDGLLSHTGAIKGWGQAFAEGGDLLIYGCNLAATAEGEALVDSLARLTGVDVAASDDMTGSARLGADWDLEYFRGEVNTDVAFSLSLRMSWDNALATYTVTSTLDDGSAGTLRWAVEQANLNAGADSIAFAISAGDANHYYYADDGVAGQVTHDGGHVLTTAASDDASITGIDADFAKSWYSISLNTTLSITDTLVIDGTTQAGYAGTPIIELDGSLVGVNEDGIALSADNSTIRGLVINRFAGEGIQIAVANGNTIQGNYIGTDVSGTIDLGNTAQGILIGGLSANNIIGGATEAQRNLISGNGLQGIAIMDLTSTGTIIQGNYIGVDATGTRALGNLHGIVIDFDAGNTLIGGSAAGEGNLISGNLRHGIELYDSRNNTVAGNLIGTGANGTGDLGNAWSGVAIGGGSYENIIGGTAAGEGNTIAGNDRYGIEVAGAAFSNAFLGNTIRDNTLLGIDINADGVTANDAGDADVGPNFLQNFPVLTSVTTDGALSVSISGTLNAKANTTYRIEFFASSSADGSGNGEGERYLGFTSVTTDGSGDALINATLSASVAESEYVTATATHDNLDATWGDTSEFAANVLAALANFPPITDDVTATGPEDANSMTIILSGSDSDGTVDFFRLNSLPANGSLYTDAGLTTLAATGVDYAATSDSLTLYFVPDPDWSGNTSFAYLAKDDGGLYSASPATAAIAINAVNDTPTTSGIPDISVNEDTLVVFIDLQTHFNDAEDPDASLTYTITNNTNPGLFSAISIGGAGGLNMNFATNQNGTADITVRATDTGGLFVESTFTVTVKPVNDAPAGTDKTVITGEDTDYIFTAGDFGFADSSDSPGNSLLAVRITSLPGAGALVLSGSGAVAIGDFISKADIDAGNLVFTPAPDTSGAGYASFRFHVQDDGGTLNGGIDLDPTSNTITIDVTAVNDAPVAVDNAYNVIEGAGGFLPPAGVLLNDTDIDSGTLTAVQVTGVAHGSLTLNANGSWWYTPDPDYYGTDSFTYKVNDGTLDSNVATVTLNVLPRNDAPAGANATVTTAEDTAYVFSSADFGFSDPVEGDLLLAVKITTLPGAGTLTLVGSGAVSAGDFISKPDIDANRLIFTPASDASGAGYVSFTFQVQDDGGTANGGTDLDQTANTLTIDVTPVADAPLITSHGGVDIVATGVAENTTHVTTITATDADVPAQPLSYAIIGGLDAALFTVDATTGVLTFASPPDYEAPTDSNSDNSYEVVVQVSDGSGGTDSQTIRASVSNVNEAPSAQTDVILADEDVGQFAFAPGLMSNDTDVDGGAGLYVYAVNGDPAGVGSTITLASGALLTVNADGSVSYDPNGAFDHLGSGDFAADAFTYTIADQGGLTSTASVTVTIVGANDAPVFSGGASGSVNRAENSATVMTLTASDADNDLLTYSVSGGADAALFSIDSVTGGLSFSAAPDFESPQDSDGNNVYEVEIGVDDGNGGVAIRQLSVTVADANDNAPVIAPGLSLVVAEDALDGTALGVVSASDADSVGSLQNWRIVSGNSAGIFDIDPSSGQISVADSSALDFETGSSHVLGIQTDDGVNSSAVETIRVDTINVNEAPSHTLPGAQTTSVGAALAFSALDGNGIQVSDPDGAGTLEVTLSVTNGTLTLSGTTGLAFSSGTGQNDSSMTFSGSADAINAALDGLLFQPDADFLGFANLTIVTDDLGSSGSGGPLNAMDTVNIDVRETITPFDILDILPTLDTLVDDFGDAQPVISDMLPGVFHDNTLLDGMVQATWDSAPGEPEPAEPESSQEARRALSDHSDTPSPLSDGRVQIEATGDDDRRASLLVQRAVQQALADPLLAAGMFVPDAPLWSVIDLMLAQMNSEDGAPRAADSVSVKAAQGLALTLTAGYVSWLLRAGYLSASLLSIAPLWRQFDPLPILAPKNKDRRKAPREPADPGAGGADETAAERVFMNAGQRA